MIEFLTRAFGGAKTESPKAGKCINLALQGGGALGAFTWGVIDHLLEDGRLTVEGISGASAGAVNAIMLADGLACGEPGWQSARRTATRGRSSVLILADRGYAGRPLDAGTDPVSFPVRFQSAQHQSAEGSGRTLCRFRFSAGIR